MKLRQPTVWRRMTVDTQARIVVEPELVPRRIRLVVPDNAFVECRLFATPESADAEMRNIDVISQDAMSPLVPPDVTIPIDIAPGQSMISRAREGFAELSVIIEYPEE